MPGVGDLGLGREERVDWEAQQTENPASRFLCLPAGHWLHHDVPEVVNAVMEQWLGRILAAPGS